MARASWIEQRSFPSGRGGSGAQRRAWSLAICITLVIVASCAPNSDDVGVFRVVHVPGRDGTPADFDELELATTTVVAEWTFSSTGEHEQWAVHQDESSAGGRQAGGKPETAPVLRLIGSVHLEARDVDHLRVVVRGPLQGAPRVEWAGRGQAFSGDRSIVGDPEVSDNPSHRVFSFRLGDHEGWRGLVTTIQVEMRPRAGWSPQVMSVEALHHEFARGDLDQAAAAAWKFSRDGVQRIGFAGIPDLPASMRVDQGVPGRQLRFHLALGSHARASAVFRVVQVPERRVLFEHRLEANDPQWSEEFTVDLPVGATGFQLTTELAEPPDPMGGLPAWGSVRVVAPSPDAKPVNVVLICLDTLRADHLSLYGYQRRTSPSIDRWARQRGVVFENAFAPAPWTLPSHISMLSGLGALRHGSNLDRPAPTSLVYLAEYLRDRGYVTEAITGGGYLDPAYGLDQGFDVVRSWQGDHDKELEDHGPRAARWLADNDVEPFFLFFHTYEVHGPFHEREPFYSEFSGSQPSASPETVIASRPYPRIPEDGFIASSGFVRTTSVGGRMEPLPEGKLEEVVDRYDAGIAAADEMVGAILEALHGSDFGQRTVVVLTSDHGEALGERGLAGHAYLDDFNLQVPLIIEVPPGVARPHRVREQVRLIDLVPTVLEVVGIDPPGDLDGVSLLSLIDGKQPEDDVGNLDVWSYAATSNRGIGLREAGTGLRYEFNNSAWGTAFGREHLQNVSVTGVDGAANRNDGEIPRLHGKTIRRAVDVLPGLWVRIRNRTAEDLEVTLRSWAVVNKYLKCLEGPRGLAWSGPGTATVVAHRGEWYLLFAEISAPRRLGLEVSGENGHPGVVAVIEETDLDTPSVLVLGDDGWVSGDAGVEGREHRASIEVWMNGAPADRGAVQAIDGGLTDRLRALGYLAD